MTKKKPPQKTLEPHELILDHLRAIRADVGSMKAKLSDHDKKFAILEKQLTAVRRNIADIHDMITDADTPACPSKERVERLEPVWPTPFSNDRARSPCPVSQRKRGGGALAAGYPPAALKRARNAPAKQAEKAGAAESPRAASSGGGASLPDRSDRPGLQFSCR